MPRRVIFLVATFILAALPAMAATTIVDGTSNTFLAGESDGTMVRGDEAPTYSPPRVTGIPINPGSRLQFIADGTTNTISLGERVGPEGGPTGGYSASWKGMAGISAPRGSLVGVFLDDTFTSSYDYWDAPTALDFWNEPRSRNYATVLPVVRQPFFIGDGSVRFLNDGTILDGTSNTVLLGDGSVRPEPYNPIVDGTANTIRLQEFIVPAGATRLYLGIMDLDTWSNNSGFLTVDVRVVPLPASLLLVGSGLLGLTGWRRFRYERAKSN